MMGMYTSMLANGYSLMKNKDRKFKKSRKKFILTVLSISIIVVIGYLLFLEPHEITTTHFVVGNTADVTITSHPLPCKEQAIEALKLFLLVNIPNFFILVKMLCMFVAKKLSKSDGKDVTR
jgi:hypothetical protein